MPRSEVVVSLTAFVTELALAWQKLSMYQSDHPERKHALDRVHAVVVGLVAPTGSMTLGVGQGALIGPEEKLTSGPAVRLAAALYVLGVAVLRIDEGITSKELEILLDLLPRTEAQHDGRDLGAELARRGVEHVRVEAVDFTGLLATDSLDDLSDGTGGGALWDRILQRLLGDERFAVDAALCAEPGGNRLRQIESAVGQVLARYGLTAVDVGEAEQGSPGSQVIEDLTRVVGGAAGESLLEELQDDGRRSAARHVKELLGAMPDGLRQGILDSAVRELVARDEAAPGLRSLGSAVSAAQMVGSLRRLRAARVDFAPRVVSAVESLVAEGAREVESSNESRDPEDLARELRAVFADQDVDRAPLAGGLDDRVFIELRRHVPVHAMFNDLSPYLETITDRRLEVDLATTLIDLLRRPFLDDAQVEWVIARQQETFRNLLAGGRFVEAATIVEALRDLGTSKQPIEPVRRAAERCLRGLAGSETLSGIVEKLGEVKGSDMENVHRLIELLGPDAIHELLCVLGDEPELSRRRNIFDLLVSLGSRVVPASIALLDNSPWYMVRNILSLLRKVGRGLSLEILTQALANDDPRVRLEAVKCIPSIGACVTTQLVKQVLKDRDPRVAELAIGVFGTARIRPAVQPLVDLLNQPDRLGRQRRLRLKALQTLGEFGDPTVLPQIAPFFRSWFAPVSVEERHAAFKSLGLYPEADRRPWVKKGRRSLDPAVREICGALGRDESDG